MTSPRRPAGAPDEEPRPAGAPAERLRKPGNAGEGAFLPDSGKKAPAGPGNSEDESAAAVDADFDALLADVRRERDEYLEIAQRARADFENYRKRAAREAQDAERRGKAALARELVPALDNLERALRAAGIDPDTGERAHGHSRTEHGPADPGARGGAGEGERAPDVDDVARGFALVYGELRGALERAGVETYDPTGEKFDPTQHEALSVRAGEDGVDTGVVIETLEKGYRLDGQVLRAARVVVSE
jgi:molecular chaperone GrpE